MALKSAYDLAMERMGKAGESEPKLSAEQKKQIAELDGVYKAKIAERELDLKPKIQEAELAGNEEEATKLRQQLTVDVQKFREELESKKEKIRSSKA